MDNRLLYKTYTAEFPLEEIQMKMADALSGYSSTKLTIGAIRDDVFGLTTREAAFPLVPALDTLDLGTNPSAVSLTLRFSADTVSCNEDAQARILQNIRVTELTQRLPVGSTTSCTQDIPHGTTPITQGTPVYSGSGDLSLTFTKAYAQKYVDALRQLGPTLRHRDEDNPIDKYEDWLNAVPGIYLSVDAPVVFKLEEAFQQLPDDTPEHDERREDRGEMHRDGEIQEAFCIGPYDFLENHQMAGTYFGYFHFLLLR